ncbi:hypothetical protein L7F22_027833 [Adiantum nelumboides]|nr:hypothetical protein [Adiantum nelumboides]
MPKRPNQASPAGNRKKTTSTRGKGGTTKKTPSSQPVEGTLDSFGSMEDIADVNVTFEEERETQQEEKELDGQNKEFGDREQDSSKDDDTNDVIPKSINKPQGLEFLESITMNKGMMPPLIPLCRCVVNEKVRELRRDLSLLKRVLEDDGYFVMKGSFILSISMPDGTTKDVDDNIMKTWDKNWCLVNKEFEEELKTDAKWSVLSNKMFFVWEGNHRTAAWMQCIKEIYQNNKKMHIRVQGQFMIPNQQDEMKLIAALQRLNIMNEEAIVKTNLKDYLYHTSMLCACDEAQFIGEFDETEKMSITRARAQEASSGKRVWYPFTQPILGCLVYGGKWKKDFELACSKISPNLPKEDQLRATIMARRNVIKAYNRKMTRMTAFATLALHKNGVSPFINMERGYKVETLLQQDLSSQIIGHCMPTLSRAQRDGKSGGWRGVLERSASHMLLFMEALCPPMGTVLEIGGGTGPVLKAAMHTGRCCMSIDDDKDICDAYLTPFIADFYGNPTVSKMQDLGVSDSDDDGDFVLNEAPLDYELPSYAEAMARHMESNPSYDRLLVQHQRSKQCIFIDDEVDFD